MRRISFQFEKWVSPFFTPAKCLRFAPITHGGLNFASSGSESIGETSVQQFIDLKNYDPERARIVATLIHMPPQSCGKTFSTLKPRIAIAYHTLHDFNVTPDTLATIRETYHGPLTIADDLLVWDVDKDAVRKVVGNDDALPASPPEAAGPPGPSERTERSKWLDAGRIDFFEMMDGSRLQCSHGTAKEP
jgi:hypothetical protein